MRHVATATGNLQLATHTHSGQLTLIQMIPPTIAAMDWLQGLPEELIGMSGILKILYSFCFTNICLSKDVKETILILYRK